MGRAPAAVRVLVLNAGSSSLKASVIATPRTTLASTTLSWGSDASRNAGWEAAVRSALDELAAAGAPLDSLGAVGHRVVHGGTRFVDAVVVDDDVLAGIRDSTRLAPLHNRVALETLDTARRLLPAIPHTVSFDTAFHRTLPPEAVRYPVPEAWSRDWGVRRFGFHGLSVAWSTGEAARQLDRSPDELGLVVAHLGSGCSVTAVWQGRSVDTSMGETPLEGLMMGTRSGSVDPGMLIRLLLEGRLNVTQMDEALEHRSGLLGVSGVSGEMEAVQAAADAGNPDAQLAVTMFVRRAAAGIAAIATSLPRVDALVFTGGIAEHAEGVRAQIAERLGAGLKDATVLVIEAREDLVIAGEAARLLG
jgi:acetate kinase